MVKVSIDPECNTLDIGLSVGDIDDNTSIVVQIDPSVMLFRLLGIFLELNHEVRTK
jgi:hypothetical protein